MSTTTITQAPTAYDPQGRLARRASGATRGQQPSGPTQVRQRALVEPLGQSFGQVPTAFTESRTQWQRNPAYSESSIVSPGTKRRKAPAKSGVSQPSISGTPGTRRRNAGVLPWSDPNVLDRAVKQEQARRERKPTPGFTATTSKGRTIPRGRQSYRYSDPIGISTGEQAVADFVGTHPNCASKEEVLRFVALIREAQWNGVDIAAVVNSLAEAKLIPERVDSRLSRVGGSTLGGGSLPFAANTSGRLRGHTGDIPSLLWSIADRECQYLPVLNNAIDQFLDGKFATERPDIVLAPRIDTPKHQEEERLAVVQFLDTHPTCQGFGQGISEFLNLVNSKKVTADTLFSAIRAAGLNQDIEPLLSRSGWRSAGLALSPASQGVTAETKDKLKYTFLWMVLEKYCDQLDKLIPFMYDVLYQKIAEPQAGGFSEQNQSMDVEPFGQFPQGGFYE